MYCPECGKPCDRIYEIVAAKTLREREPEPKHCCDACLSKTLLGVIQKGKIIKVRLFKQ